MGTLSRGTDCKFCCRWTRRPAPDGSLLYVTVARLSGCGCAILCAHTYPTTAKRRGAFSRALHPSATVARTSAVGLGTPDRTGSQLLLKHTVC